MELIHHYVYRITNTKENKHYYGVRSSKVEPKLDLGIKYFSSSSVKSFIKEQKENKDIFKYKIVRCFVSRELAELFEVKLHEKFNVSINEKFYNKSKNTPSGFNTQGIKLSEFTKFKSFISRFNREKRSYVNNTIVETTVLTDKLDEYLTNGWVLGRLPMSDLQKLKISESNSGKLNGRIIINNSVCVKYIEECDLDEHLSSGRVLGRLCMKDETKAKLSIINTGKILSAETKNKMSQSKKGKKQSLVSCPHCGKEGGVSTMKQHHFDKCKFINQKCADEAENGKWK